jgi:hypothetical protein
MAATVLPALCSTSEEEEEDDVVDYFEAAFKESDFAIGLESNESIEDNATALVILEGDRAGDEDPLALANNQVVLASDSPVHPVPRMQEAFEESILESSEEPTAKRDVPGSPRMRHLRMLDEEEYNSSYNLRFRLERTSNYHPLWKLMSQIAFGVHLLHKRLAKSNDEVIRILQSHVDEVDGWVDTTKEDLDFAIADVRERSLQLRTPLEHAVVFDSMLNDTSFRSSISEGNRRIELIVSRTSIGLKDMTCDIHQGGAATFELAKYMERLVRSNLPENDHITPTIRAMRGNAEGWSLCFRKLQGKANTLGLALQQLRLLLSQMSKRTARASRNSFVSLPSQHWHFQTRCLS